MLFITGKNKIIIIGFCDFSFLGKSDFHHHPSTVIHKEEERFPKENVLKSIEINNFYNTGDLLYVESYGKKANHPFVQKKTVYFVSNKTKINSLVKKMPEPKARSPG